MVSPRLETILMVEKSLKKHTIITIPKLKKALPKQVNHNTLKIILEYLEQSNKILLTMKGITWIHTTNKNFKSVISKGKRM
tara:strand:+ start:841 stop:1083 length:243 start_codon:yes stop_codon:yes gene_type:complete